jgi:hypothetical protein
MFLFIWVKVHIRSNFSRTWVSPDLGACCDNDPISANRGRTRRRLSWYSEVLINILHFGINWRLIKFWKNNNNTLPRCELPSTLLPGCRRAKRNFFASNSFLQLHFDELSVKWRSLLRFPLPPFINVSVRSPPNRFFLPLRFFTVQHSLQVQSNCRRQITRRWWKAEAIRCS